jgi:Nuclease-related domain
VAPAPGAEATPGSGQNTGVNGTRHAVVQNPTGPTPTDSRPAPGGPRTRRLPRPIRYAHAEAGQPAAVEPPAPTGSPTGSGAPTVPAMPVARADEPEPLSGVVLPPVAPPPQPVDDPPAHGTRPAQSTRPAQTPWAAQGTPPAADAPPAAVTPANEGLGIFNGVATTEATDDAPARDAGRRPLRRAQPGAQAGAQPAGAESPRAATVGATWNQPISPPPVPSSAAEEEKPASFGRVLGFIRGPAPADDEQPRVTVRDLPPDVQLAFWRTRLLLMVVIGAVVAALTRNWEIAVTLAVLAGILDTIRRSRGAAQFMNGYKDHLAARKRTRGQLVKMRREGYFTLDDRPVPNSPEVIDHLVVGPTGVYAIDSEKWDAKLPIRTLNGRRLYLGPESQKERLDHAVWEASQASEILSAALGYDVPVRPALAIYGPKVPWDVTTIRNVDVFTGSALGKYLKQRYRKRNQPNEGVPSLTREEVRTIYDTAARMLPEVAPSRTSTPVG